MRVEPNPKDSPNLSESQFLSSALRFVFWVSMEYLVYTIGRYLCKLRTLIFCVSVTCCGWPERRSNSRTPEVAVINSRVM